MKRNILMLFCMGTIVMNGLTQSLGKPLIEVGKLSPGVLSRAHQQRLNGISAIQYFNNDSILIVSDSDLQKSKSYMFIINNKGRVLSSKAFYELCNIESVRFNNKLKKLFYSFESGSRTGVGFLESPTTSKILFSVPMDSVITSKNRGIEGITFDSHNNLWASFESGAGECDSGVIPFFRFQLNGEGSNYDTASRKIFEYPIDRCICVTNQNQGQFNGSNGNGVSEILAFPNDTSRLLVLERCFDTYEKVTSVRLYIATIPATGSTIVKSQLYDFGCSGIPSFHPQNIEGMTWGDHTDSLYTLYTVSDSNYKLSNQFIILTFPISP
jgi:hypothetical protein